MKFLRGNFNLVVFVAIIFLAGFFFSQILSVLPVTRFLSFPKTSFLAITSPSLLPSVIVDVEKELESLVVDFYSALEKQNGVLVFSFMTPPETEAEAREYSWASGSDLPEPGFRVFWRLKIFDPQIKSTEKISETRYLVNLSDWTMAWGNADPVTGWQRPVSRNIKIEMIQSWGRWMINKFSFDCGQIVCGGNMVTEKYSGFGQ